MSNLNLRRTIVRRLVIGKILGVHITDVQQYALTTLLNTGLKIFKSLDVFIIFQYFKSLRIKYYS